MEICEHCNYSSYIHKNFLRHICKEKTNFQCIFCNKYYKTSKSLNEHITSNCKKKEELKEIVKKDNEIALLKEELEKQKQTITTPTNITNNTNSNNIIQIINLVLPHNKPNISHLTDLDYYNILGRSLNSIPQMIEHIHFNKNMPQNHNLYISNIKNKYVMAYDGKDWSLKNRDDVITDLINENEMRMEDWLSSEESIHEKYPNAMKRFDHYLRMKEKDKNLDMIKNEIQMLLYNKRNMIKN